MQFFLLYLGHFHLGKTIPVFPFHVPYTFIYLNPPLSPPITVFCPHSSPKKSVTLVVVLGMISITISPYLVTKKTRHGCNKNLEIDHESDKPSYLLSCTHPQGERLHDNPNRCMDGGLHESNLHNFLNNYYLNYFFASKEICMLKLLVCCH